MRKRIWRRTVATVAVAVVAMGATSAVADADVPFEFLPDSVTFTQSGAGADVNGGHPDTTIGFTLDSPNPAAAVSATNRPPQAPRTATVTLPAGLIGDPTAVGATCPMDAVVLAEKKEALGVCPRAAAAGVVYIEATYPDAGVLPIQERRLWRVPAGSGEVAAFGSSILSVPIRIGVSVTPSGGYRVRAVADQLTQAAIVRQFRVTLWGVPARNQGPGPQCDGARVGTTKVCLVTSTNPSYELATFGGPLHDAVQKPFMTNPSVCGADLETSVRLVPYGTVFAPIEATVDGGTLSGCESQPFDPSIDVTPASRKAGEPSGYTVGIDVPQDLDPDGVGTAHVKDVSVTLPAGVAISPPSADGLDACSDAQLDLHGDGEVTCPDASKIGSLRIDTPVLEEPVTGTAFLGTQLSSDPASGDMYRLFLVARAQGVLVKLKGAVRADPATGRLTTTFEDNPQLPFSRLELSLLDGERASLANPPACGTYRATARLTSWAGQSVDVGSSFAIDQGCPTGAFAPGFTAGTTDPVGGAYSPFTLRVMRADGQQNISTVGATLPEGLLAKLAGVPLCGDAEAVSGDCPAASQVGTTTVAAGAGDAPLYVPQPGKAPTGVYLAGPYKGAPYSLVVKVPAQAGPFDLGTVTVRNALHVDPTTAQVTASSDPLPQIVGGIPISYRDIRIDVDRPGFTVNPTSCDPAAVAGTIGGAQGATAQVSDRFQVADCAALGFQPGLKLQLKGDTGRTGHPALKAVLTAAPGQANIGRAQVGLPHAEFLDQGNLNKVCVQADLKAGTCPASSIYGHARAWSPLLDKPLEGPVYLGVGYGYKLPALVADLNGQIRVLLVGRIDTTKQKGLRSTFEAVPDAPVSRFVLEMKGGRKYGLLENSEDICAKGQNANARFTGQNGKVLQLHPRIAVGCGKAGKK